MGKYRLFAYDLDGTLLATDKSLPEENRSALIRAHGEGIIMVPSTGRLYLGVNPEIRSLGISRYYIVCNGASLYDAEKDLSLYSAELPLDDMLALTDYLKTRFDVAQGCYRSDIGLMSFKDRDNLSHYFKDSFMMGYILSVHRGVPDLREEIAGAGLPVSKTSFYFADPAERQYCLETLPSVFPHIKFTSSVPNNIECNSSMADKGLALEALCNELGIPLSECAAFGDGLNDIPMLKAAGLGVAMANAPDDVKAVSDMIADTNDNAGVGKTMLSLLDE